MKTIENIESKYSYKQKLVITNGLYKGKVCEFLSYDIKTETATVLMNIESEETHLKVKIGHLRIKNWYEIRQ